MAFTEYYVDYTGTGSGSGTSGDPWGTFAYAMTELRAAGLPSGDTKVWIKAGSDDTTLEGIVEADFPVPSVTSRLWFEGYTTTTGDGSLTTAPVLTRSTTGQLLALTNLDFMSYRYLDFRVPSGGSAPAYGIQVDRNTRFLDCVFRGYATTALLSADAAQGLLIKGCAFLDGRRLLNASGSGAQVYGCFFKPGVSSTGSNAHVAIAGVFENNCVYLDIDGSAGSKVIDSAQPTVARFNSFYSTSGVTTTDVFDLDINAAAIYGNYMDGFNSGILIAGANHYLNENRFYNNNGSSISNPSSYEYEGSTNTTLGASGLTKGAEPDETNWKDWFKPTHSERDADGKLIGASYEHTGGGTSGLSRLIDRGLTV